MKKHLSCLVALLFIVLYVPTVVQAKSITMSLKVGDVEQINSILKSNVSWTVKGTSIKLLDKDKKSCVIRAVKAGKSYLYLKVKGKAKVKYTISVKETTSESVETSYDFFTNATKALVYFKNKESYPVKVSATITAYKGTDKVASKKISWQCLGSESTGAEVIDADSGVITDVKVINLKVSKSKYEDPASMSKLYFALWPEYHIAVSADNCDTVSGYYVFVDENNKPCHAIAFTQEEVVGSAEEIKELTDTATDTI